MKSTNPASSHELQPDSLARRLFVLALVGVVTYVVVVISLMASGR